MNQPLEKLLGSLPKKKLSRKADLKIRFNLWRIQISQAWQEFDLSMAKGWQAGLASGLIMLIGLSSTGVYAYSSDKVNRQSRLYPIKRTLENIEKSVTKKAASQPALQAKFASRRFAEARTLISGSNDPKLISDDLDLTLGEANENIKSANEDIDSMENENEQEKIIEQLGSENQRHSQDLERIAVNLSLDDDEKIVDAVANTLENLEQQKAFLKSLSKKQRSSTVRGKPASTSAAVISTTSKPADVPVATASSTTAKEKSEKSKDLESLKQMKKRVESFKKEQEKKQKQKPNPKAEKFIKNLEKKVDQAESSIKQGDKESFQKIYDTTTALTNTGNHFIASSSEKSPDRQEEINKPAETRSEERPEDERITEQRREQDSKRYEERRSSDSNEEHRD
ncbi:hypothetical protein HGA34_05505 [Candidatus Falkowbacteria bacterium]|nr:hypothetical protein [Candidatus Falkowbacteria bacterium]